MFDCAQNLKPYVILLLVSIITTVLQHHKTGIQCSVKGHENLTSTELII